MKSICAFWIILIYNVSPCKCNYNATFFRALKGEVHQKKKIKMLSLFTPRLYIFIYPSGNWLYWLLFCLFSYNRDCLKTCRSFIRVILDALWSHMIGLCEEQLSCFWLQMLHLSSFCCVHELQCPVLEWIIESYWVKNPVRKASLNVSLTNWTDPVLKFKLNNQ